VAGAGDLIGRLKAMLPAPGFFRRTAGLAGALMPERAKALLSGLKWPSWRPKPLHALVLFLALMAGISAWVLTSPKGEFAGRPVAIIDIDPAHPVPENPPEVAPAPTPPPVAEAEHGGAAESHGGAAPEAKKPPERTASAIVPAPPPPVGETGALPPVPDPALVTEGPDGFLPVVAPDGRAAWRVYARPFPSGDSRPRIAILIGGLGLSPHASRDAVQRLPGAVSLAFAPYSTGLQEWIAEARAGGHEVLVEVPMEPFDYPANDPGPFTLVTTAKPDDNIARLQWVLSRFTGYVGVTNFLGGKFTQDAAALKPILEQLKFRGLLLLDAKASQQSVAAQTAQRMGIPAAEATLTLDTQASRVAIDQKLTMLEEIARKEGVAIGLGFAYPVTVERVATWARTLEAKGIVLAPVSAIASVVRVK